MMRSHEKKGWCGRVLGSGLMVLGLLLLVNGLPANELSSAPAARVTPQAKKKPVKNTLSKKVKPSHQDGQLQKTKIKHTAKLKIKDLKKSIQRTWDFQDPQVTKIPTIWEPLSGSWRIMAEPEHPGNRVLQQRDIKRNFQYLTSKQKFVNFEFSARMRTDMFEQKTRNWQMGLIFRQASPDAYYKFRITAANVALLRCSPLTDHILPGSGGNSRAASATGRFGKSDEEMLLILPWNASKDSWHTLKVVCYGERIILKMDGREIRMVDDGLIGSGKVGVFSYKTRAFFDDLRLYYLPVPPDVAHSFVLSNEPFSLKNDRDLLVYYKNPKTEPLEIKVMGPDNRLFAILSKGLHHAGMNSFVWNGQGLDGRLPKPGTYAIIWQSAEGKPYRKKNINIKP